MVNFSFLCIYHLSHHWAHSRHLNLCSSFYQPKSPNPHTVKLGVGFWHMDFKRMQFGPWQLMLCPIQFEILLRHKQKYPKQCSGNLSNF